MHIAPARRGICGLHAKSGPRQRDSERTPGQRSQEQQESDTAVIAGLRAAGAQRVRGAVFVGSDAISSLNGESDDDMEMLMAARKVGPLVRRQ